MALPATHFYFALQASANRNIDHMEAYLSGTLYPDSRWLTGVDRGATHAPQCLEESYSTTDFRLGWHQHCRCDQLQRELLVSATHLDHLNSQDRWIHMVVMKMIQDQIAIAAIDIDPCLAALDYVDTPNNEDSEDVARYFTLIRTIYSGKKALSLEDFEKLWLGVGLDRRTTREIIEVFARTSNAPDAVAHLQKALADLLILA